MELYRYGLPVLSGGEVRSLSIPDCSDSDCSDFDCSGFGFDFVDCAPMNSWNGGD